MQRPAPGPAVAGASLQVDEPAGAIRGREVRHAARSDADADARADDAIGLERRRRHPGPAGLGIEQIDITGLGLTEIGDRHPEPLWRAWILDNQGCGTRWGSSTRNSPRAGDEHLRPGRPRIRRDVEADVGGDIDGLRVAGPAVDRDAADVMAAKSTLPNRRPGHASVGAFEDALAGLGVGEVVLTRPRVDPLSGAVDSDRADRQRGLRIGER